MTALADLATLTTGPSTDHPDGQPTPALELSDDRLVPVALLTASVEDDDPAVVGTATDDVPLPADAIATLSASSVLSFATAIDNLMAACGDLRKAAGGPVDASDVSVDPSGFVALSGADVQAVLEAADALFAAGSVPETITLTPTRADDGWTGSSYALPQPNVQPGITPAGMKASSGTLHDLVDVDLVVPGLFVRWNDQATISPTTGGPSGTYKLRINGVETADIAYDATRGDIIAAIGDAMFGTYDLGALELGVTTPLGIVFVEDLGGGGDNVQLHTTFKFPPKIEFDGGGLVGLEFTDIITAHNHAQIALLCVDETNTVDPMTYAGLTGVLATINVDPGMNGTFTYVAAAQPFPPGTANVWLILQGLEGDVYLGIDSPEGEGFHYDAFRCVITQA